MAAPDDAAFFAQVNDSWYERLDPGIRPAVRALLESGIRTFESCQGGPGHGYELPTVLFCGDADAGVAAVAALLAAGHQVAWLSRVWDFCHLVEPLLAPQAPHWEVRLSGRQRDGKHSP